MIPAPRENALGGATEGRDVVHVRAVRSCIAWLHARAQEMNDPHARAVLNSAAFSLGVDKPAPAIDGRVASAAVRFRVGADVGAVKADDWVILSMPPPARHHHVLHAMSAVGLIPGAPIEQGFTLADGTWADRETALKIATAAGQLVKNPGATSSPIAPPFLFSEDMW